MMKTLLLTLLVTGCGASLPAEEQPPPIQESAKSECCVFPITQRPTHSYLSNPRKFGAPRANDRLHSACDLYRPNKGEDVIAIEGGKVIRGPYLFYQGTYALEIKHDSGLVARYGEITDDKVNGVKTGSAVKKGQVIGYIGKVNSNCCSPMLNFELFEGTATGTLTQNRKPYNRREDLLNPTSRLQKWEKDTFGTSYLLPDPTPTLELDLVSGPESLTLRHIEDPSESQEFISILLEAALNSNSVSDIYVGLSQKQSRLDSTLDISEEAGVLHTIKSIGDEAAEFHNLKVQFFDSDSSMNSAGEGILQHISVETSSKLQTLKENAYEVAQSLGAPVFETEDFVQWRLPKGYVLWIKEEADISRIAVELEP